MKLVKAFLQPLIFCVAMTGPLASALRSKILRLLLLHWSPLAIAEEVHCHRNTLSHSASMKSSMNCSFRAAFDWEARTLIIRWVIFHPLLWSSLLLIASFSNCSKFHILKELLFWASTEVDHSSRLLTRRQAEILNDESAIWSFNFIASIFEVERSSTMFLASLSSLQRREVSSSNWAISTDRALFSYDIWTLTRSAAFACRWSSTAWALHAFFAALKLSMICFLKLRGQLTLTAAPAVFALTAASTMILAATSVLTLRAASALTSPEGFFDLDE